MDPQTRVPPSPSTHPTWKTRIELRPFLFVRVLSKYKYQWLFPPPKELRYKCKNKNLVLLPSSLFTELVPSLNILTGPTSRQLLGQHPNHTIGHRSYQTLPFLTFFVMSGDYPPTNPFTTVQDTVPHNVRHPVEGVCVGRYSQRHVP